MCNGGGHVGNQCEVKILSTVHYKMLDTQIRLFIIDMLLDIYSNPIAIILDAMRMII